MDLPVKASETAALAELIFAQADGKPLTDELRNRLSGRAGLLQLLTVKPYFGSLARDPSHPSTYYLAADGRNSQSLLLHIALASAPTSGIFPNALLIGRMRAGGREIVVNSVPFASKDWDHLSRYVEQVDPAFLPRPQGARPAIAVGNRHPEISLPAAFEAFRTILKNTGVNMASTVQLSATREMTTDDAIAARNGENPTAAGHTRVSIRHLYHAGLWAAIRAGWREGYNAEADHFIVSGNTPDEIARSVESAKEAIRHASGYTKFTTDTSRLFMLEADTRHPRAWDDVTVNDKFHQLFSPEERNWILDEFSKKFITGEESYHLSDGEIRRLAVKFGQSLKLNEDLYDTIKKQTKLFDFEPSIDEAETLTTPAEMIFYMHWLKLRGRPAQLVPPNLGFKKRQAYPETTEALEKYAHHKMWPELLPRVMSGYGGKPLEELGARVKELAAVARHFQGTLSIHSGSGKQAEVLERIGRSTAGRVNYKISGELQLQLFDVLSEEPAGSRCRQLFERMCDRTNEFAAKGAFGAESELAAQYQNKYLGDAERGRVDGNLFLVFWLGNVVGCRDLNSPDGDHRFFKEKLDELPADLVAEVRRRNAKYIVWLADHLRG
jgi:tagaturonate epimerase